MLLLLLSQSEAWWCIKAYNNNRRAIFILACKNNNFFCPFLHPSFVSSITESDKRPLKKVVARAGTNLTLACAGAVGEKSVLKIEKLTWKSSQTIIKFINGRPLEQNQRVSADKTRHQWGFSIGTHTAALSIGCFSICFTFDPFSPFRDHWIQKISVYISIRSS